MSMNRLMKLSLTVSIVVFLVIGFILPNSVIAIHNDNVDGIQTDSFDDRNSTKRLTNGTSQCIWEDGTILLTQTSTGGRDYTFADGGSYQLSNHKAYYYQSALPINTFFSFLFSPARHLGAEREFDADFQYPNIEHFNETTNRYAESSSIGYKKYVVQHFRFKLDGTADTIGDLDIFWYGKADNARKISMYYWKSSTIALLSGWKLLDDANPTGDIALFKNLSTDNLKLALDSNNFIDICVVATKVGSECTLFTDYVKLRSTQQKGYKIGYGLVQTNYTFDLGAKRYWDLLTWDDFESGSATVNYQILYNKAGSFVPIENSVLPGNEQGFTTPPISLSSISNTYSSIKIQANLTTKNPSLSPKIFSWTITWQTQNRWQDHFNSEYRIDGKDKVNFGNGAVNISLASGNWPMFGQNTENTRVSTGKAAYSGNLYWWSDYPELRNQTPSNPVIDGDSLYFTAINQENHGWLYKYNSTVVSSDKIGKIFSGDIRDFSQISNGKPLVGSPVIYDQYIVVATGELNGLNSVYAFYKDDPSKNAAWTFNYSTYNVQQPKICYWGSPVFADGLLYLTGWSGVTSLAGYHINNKLLVLDTLNNGALKWEFTFPSSTPNFLSPTWSFSTPAISEGKVIVGCMNDQGDNLFAFDAKNNGSLLWNISVGAIGKASPVVYNDTVFMVSEQKEFDGMRKKTKVTAININDGSILWEAPLGRTLFTLSSDPTYCLAQVTPAVADNILYVTSPDGWVTALDLLKNGTEVWSHQVYNKLFPSDPILTSSPAYADHILYVGTPNGFLYALNTSTNGTERWNRQTFPYDQAIPVVTDPIVTNGVVVFGGENGRFYVCGVFVKPNEQLSGSITSLPIHLPEGYWWKKFNAVVQTDKDPTINKITFSLLDEQKNLIKVLTNGTDISVQNKTLARTLRLHADFWAKNSSVNPKLLFWNVTFYEDTDPPFINLNTLTPNPNGWLNEVLPQFTVNVVDNITGLLVSSAQYSVEYILQNQTYRSTNKPVCTGSNGTTQVQQITVNLSKLDFFDNITALRSLRINISDLAGNTASKTVLFQQDTKKPTSSVLVKGMKPKYNATFIRINATANDTGTPNVDASGIKQVELYYRYSVIQNFSGDWIFFANSSISKPTWKFNFTNHPLQHGGYFELCTIATDYANNREDFPTHGDISFLYDWKAPDLPSFSGDTLWFKERPTFSEVFEDDYRLDTIQYRPNFDNIWTTIASDINASTYGNSWSLKEEYWAQMEEDEVYYLYFRINDTLGNTLLVTSDNQAITIRKDTSKPIVTIDIPTSETEMTWAENFTVLALVNDQNGSGIEDVSLYYRFSTDDSNWSSWNVYGDTLRYSPFEWDFTTVEGDGYYEFKINVIDVAGNEVESEVFASSVSSFPTTLALVMISLVIVLLFISTVIFIKWRKQKQ
jgi:outer membrane protein assembly factor BamB